MAERIVVRLAPGIHAILLIGIVTVWMVAINPGNAAAQVTYEIGEPQSTGDPVPILSVSSPQTCSDQTQILPNGGYLKVQGNYLLSVDVVTTNAGTCNRLLDRQPYDSMDHGVVKDWYWGYYTSPDWPISFFAPGPYPHTYDTRSPNGGTPTYADNGLFQVGTYHLQFKTLSNATECNFPTSSNVVEQTVNTLTCGPEFSHDPWNYIVHLPKTAIDVFVPATMAGLYGPVDGAIGAWNAALSSLGITLTRKTSACSGSACITFDEASLPGKCAQTGVPTNPGSGGQATNTTTMTFTTGDATILSWHDASTDPTALQRTVAHELGHALGMTHPSHSSGCSAVGDAVMLDMVTTCNGATSGYQPTINDTLPVSKTVYGGGPQVKCGF